MRSTAAPSTGWNLARALFVLLFIFNVALPKGGIKIGGLPLTWGYVLVGLATVPAAIGILRRGGKQLPPLLQLGCCFLPVAFLIIVKWLVYAVPMASTAVYLVQFFVLPVIMLGFLVPYLEDVPADLMGRVLVWTLRFCIAWGLLNFVVYPLTHQFIEIPYVTINAADAEDIYSKNNARGILMKLVSTYNNGNLFGACMIMLAPMYFLFEKRRTWMILFIVAMICTLSRTVWFAMAALTGIMILTGQIEIRRTKVWLGIVIAVGILIAVLPLMGWTPDKLVDSGLGGRAEFFDAFELSFFGGSKLVIPEIVYFGFLNSFGIVGFLFAFAALAAGPLFGLMNWPRLSPLRRAAVAGLAGYMAAALIDGAFIFPPTLLQFLFVTGIVYRRGLRPEALVPQVGRHGSIPRRPMVQAQHA